MGSPKVWASYGRYCPSQGLKVARVSPSPFWRPSPPQRRRRATSLQKPQAGGPTSPAPGLGRFPRVSARPAAPPHASAPVSRCVRAPVVAGAPRSAVTLSSLGHICRDPVSTWGPLWGPRLEPHTSPGGHGFTCTVTSRARVWLMGSRPSKKEKICNVFWSPSLALSVTSPQAGPGVLAEGKQGSLCAEV